MHPESPRQQPDPSPAASYPPWILTSEQRRRWDLSAAVAADLHAGDGPAMIWSATRAIYQSEIETG